ncbi:dynein light chain Tctex-type 5-B-like [Oscarella lobularis]|uniref:dynein light chain Tctex-type 5-B-like n=1 Tax=Oscarella lobularis TaxID=121494 RepID=UPI003313C4EB
MAQAQGHLLEAKLEAAATTTNESRLSTLRMKTSAVFSFDNIKKAGGVGGASVSRIQMSDAPGQRAPGDVKRRVTYENTYRMEPTKAFPYSKVKSIIAEVMTRELEKQRYEPIACRQLTKTLSEMIKSRVKDLDLARYRLVCVVHIGELKDQGVRVASQCVWNPEWDCYSEFSFKNSSLFAIGVVYGIYTE